MVTLVHREARRLWLWGIHLLVFIRSSLFRHVSLVQTDVAVDGSGASAAQQGRCRLRICFVSSHFAARASRVRARAEKFSSIVVGLRLGSLEGKSVEMLHQFHHIFWFGDLNYLVDIGVSGTEPEFKSVATLESFRR